jgi:protein O-GlcNAc transferase
MGLQHHRAGRLADAEALYRQILAVQPRHADALHFLGLIAHQVGRHELAVEWIRQAIVFDPNNPVAHSNLGEACRAIGRLDEAVAACRRALELTPDFPNAHLNLGNAFRERGQLDEAVAAYRRALHFKPDYPEAQSNLGNALRDRGQLDEAVAAHRRALQLQPDYPAAHNNLGAALAEQGQLDKAVAAYRRALELKSDYPEALHNLGNALRERGQLDEAAAAFRKALEIKSDYPEARNNLGVVLAEQGQLDEAVAVCRRALELRPDNPEAHNNLGAALKDLGQLDEAVAVCRRALELRPDYAEACNNLGNALKARGQLEEAAAAYRQSIALQPDNPETYNNLGSALAGRGQFDEAVAACRHALELNPDYPDAHNNLGDALKDQGELDEAIGAFRRALQLKPKYALAHSNLVFTLHFHPDHNERTISEEHQRWNRQFSDPLKQFFRLQANDPAVARRLRIGYVSPDFRDHPAGRYVLPLLERHDRERFDVLCYSGVLRPDWMTERLRAPAGPARNASRSDAGGEWRSTVGVPDARLAEMIREDGVDILVDLAMHTAGNRLPMFARQPAPVQVTWLAYPGSTGLPSIGYRLTDAWMDPPGEEPAWSAEEPVRLPDCWCCYDPVGETPEINELPALSAQGVTFGSLNNFAKAHKGVLALWARVLEAVKGSRLVMLCPEGSARERVRAFFGARGIAVERVELVGYLPRWEYLRLYQRIDLGLDPFPFNGMTTTCDALWMGVPVLTLPGEMPASRAGLSLLSSVGLGELAASSEEDYVRMAVELAGNLPRLADLRATLRARMQASPLMDAPRFARNVESAYRSMWQAWCNKQSSAPE